MNKTILAKTLVPSLLVLLVAAGGCKKKEEEPPPLPSAAPAPTPTPAPPPVVIQAEEDAGAPEDAATDAKKVVTGKAAPADVAGLRACCTALAQNAASMPAPGNAFAMQAAAMCQGMVAGLASGSVSKGGALGAIGQVMKGAGLPPACR